MKIRFCLSVLVSTALLGACARDDMPALPEERLPNGALDVLQAHVRAIGNGDLSCDDQVLSQAPRVSTDINADGRPDFAVDTRNLHCTSRDGNVPDAYFCGFYMCGFPLLVSNAESWDVVQLMAGNEIEVVDYYREARFRVRQINLGDPTRRTVLIREYAWRDGRLQRVAERTEDPRHVAER